MVTVFPRNHTFNIPVFEMLNEVNAKGKGVLQLQYIGGPEAVPPTESSPRCRCRRPGRTTRATSPRWSCARTARSIS